MIEETRSTSGLVCPYCGHEDADAWEYVDEDGSETRCDRCDKPFSAVLHKTFTYIGKPKENPND